MEQVNEAADWAERARYAAEFARVAWLGLEQTARDMHGQVVSFTLERNGDGIEAEVVIAAPERECRFRIPIWPSPAHPPDLAANLFTTAIEERLRAPGSDNPAAQLDLASRRVADRRRRTRPGEADRYLAGALHSHAGLLARYDRHGEALQLLDEAIDHYARLAGHHLDGVTASLTEARTLRADCLTRTRSDDTVSKTGRRGSDQPNGRRDE